MDDAFEAAKARFLEGIRCAEAGRLAEAEHHFLASLEHLPGRPSTLVNLASVRWRLGRPADALEALERALRHAPDDDAAWFQHGQALQALQRPAEALASYERVLALKPEAGAAWSQRGGILKDMGRLKEAAACFERALEHGADLELNRYLLASVQAAPGDRSHGEAAPPTAPRHYVESLFDSYADDFDEHLVKGLGYRTPWRLAERLPAGRRFAAALDLGCGTGLMGPLLAPRCGALDGVDLSSRMLARAHALGVYRHLVHGDIVDLLRTTGERYDLVVAADVFVYIGDLAPAFEGAARVLESGGLFAFSIEEAEGADARFELRASSRYAHSEALVKQLARARGFDEVASERTTLRHDQGRPIGGLIVVLARPAR